MNENVKLLQHRVHELEKAVKDANKWLMDNEGVSLNYYSPDPFQAERPVHPSSAVIRGLIGAQYE